MTQRYRTADDLRCCNCSVCGCELLGVSELHWYCSLTDQERSLYPRMVAGRIMGRPLCAVCLTCKPKATIGTTISILEEDGAGPWYENARRAMEEGSE